MAGSRKNASKTPGRGSGRPFAKGNPGKPPGARHRTTIAVEQLLEDEAEAIGRVVATKALEGDPTCLRLAMERLAPLRRGRPVRFALPPLDTAADLPKALGAVLKAIGDGAVTPDEGVSLAQIVEVRRRAIETMEIEARVAILEERATDQ